MEFQELSDKQWAFLQPLLPPQARIGRPRGDNGILYVRITGCRGQDMPRR